MVLQVALQLVRQLAVPAVVSIQELAEGLTAVQIETPGHFAGRTLSELDLRNRYGVTLIALRRPEKGNKTVRKLVFPRHDTRLEPGDLLILVGGDEDVTLFTKSADEESS